MAENKRRNLNFAILYFWLFKDCLLDVHSTGTFLKTTNKATIYHFAEDVKKYITVFIKFRKEYYERIRNTFSLYLTSSHRYRKRVNLVSPHIQKEWASSNWFTFRKNRTDQQFWAESIKLLKRVPLFGRDSDFLK